MKNLEDIICVTDMRYDVASRANQVNLILILMAYSSYYLAGILYISLNNQIYINISNTIERIDTVNWSN